MRCNHFRSGDSACSSLFTNQHFPQPKSTKLSLFLIIVGDSNIRKSGEHAQVEPDCKFPVFSTTEKTSTRHCCYWGPFFLYAYRIARAGKSVRDQSTDNNYLIRIKGRKEDRSTGLLVSWFLEFPRHFQRQFWKLETYSFATVGLVLDITKFHKSYTCYNIICVEVREERRFQLPFMIP